MYLIIRIHRYLLTYYVYIIEQCTSSLLAPLKSVSVNIYEDNWKYRDSTRRKDKRQIIERKCECGSPACQRSSTDTRLCDSNGCIKYLIQICKYFKCLDCRTSSCAPSKKVKL